MIRGGDLSISQGALVCNRPPLPFMSNTSLNHETCSNSFKLGAGSCWFMLGRREVNHHNRHPRDSPTESAAHLRAEDLGSGDCQRTPVVFMKHGTIVLVACTHPILKRSLRSQIAFHNLFGLLASMLRVGFASDSSLDCQRAAAH